MKSWEELKTNLDNVTFEELYEIWEDVCFTIDNYPIWSDENKEAEKILFEIMDEFDKETIKELRKEYEC